MVSYTVQALLIIIADNPDKPAAQKAQQIKARLQRVHSDQSYWISMGTFAVGILASLLVGTVAVLAVLTKADMTTSSSTDTVPLWESWKFAAWLIGELTFYSILLSLAFMVTMAVVIGIPLEFLSQYPNNRSQGVKSSKMILVYIALSWLAVAGMWMWTGTSAEEGELFLRTGSKMKWFSCSFGLTIAICIGSITGVRFLKWIYDTLENLTRKRREKNGWQGSVMVGFAIAHLTVLLLYCAYGYDPEGTVKPAWTDKLG